MIETHQPSDRHDSVDIERGARGTFTAHGARQAAARSAEARRALRKDPKLALLGDMRKLTAKERKVLALDPTKARAWLALMEELEAHEGAGTQAEGGTSPGPGGEDAALREEYAAMVAAAEARRAAARESTVSTEPDPPHPLPAA